MLLPTAQPSLQKELMFQQAGHSGNPNKEIVMLFWLPVSCLGHLPCFCEVYHWPIPESESKEQLWLPRTQYTVALFLELSWY